jgi:hypothetical protein
MNHDNTVPATLMPRHFSEPAPKVHSRFPGVTLVVCVTLIILFLMLKR